MLEKISPMEKYLISQLPKKINIEEVNAAESGRFQIFIDETKFEAFFVNKTESDVMFVFLNGSRIKGHSPVFKRWSWYDFLPGSMLNIDDPMFDDYPELTLGWYYGNAKESYCDGVVDIVSKYQRITNVKKVIFYASSGGATAAILASSKVPGSIAICINPQLYIKEYDYSPIFERITGFDLSEADVLCRNDLGRVIDEAKRSRFILVENMESETDRIQLHKLYNSCNRKFNENPGIEKIKENTVVWKYKARSYSVKRNAAHNSQEWTSMFWAIYRLAGFFESEREIGDWNVEYINYSRFWEEKYNLEIERKRDDRTAILLDKNRRVEEFYSEKIQIKGCIEDVWRHIKLEYKFLPSQVYEITIQDYDKDNDIISIVVKDMQANKVVNTFEVNKPMKSIIYVASKEQDDLQFRIYPGRLGKKSKCDIVNIYGVTINRFI